MVVISTRMIKICDASICKSLELIFRSCLENGKFLTEWKNANVILAHRKGDKQNLNNYRQISLLFVTGKYLKEYCIITCMNSLQKTT